MGDVSEPAEAMKRAGFTWIQERFGDPADALAAAAELIAARRAEASRPPLAVIGDFVLPPPGGPDSRDFQTLHFDFGVPLDPKVLRDVGRYTALHIPQDFEGPSARTRLVPLTALLGQRTWPARTELLARLADYGRSHGAWDDAHGYVEGSLARVVEAAAGSPLLPSVKAEPGFLCGTEFDNLRSEVAFFERHSLSLEAVTVEVGLSPGELLVFDNFALAHGRRGSRRAGELRQWVFGEDGVGVAEQLELRERVLSAFERQAAADAGVTTVVAADAG